MTGRRDRASSRNGIASLAGFPDGPERNRLMLKLSRKNRQTEIKTHMIELHCERADEIIRPRLLRLLKQKPGPYQTRGIRLTSSEVR